MTTADDRSAQAPTGARPQPTAWGAVPGLALLLLLLLPACAAGPTGFERSSGGPADYGWSELDLGDDEFSVSFRGNEQTSLEQAREHATRRVEQIVAERGAAGYEVLGQVARSRTAAVPGSGVIVSNGVPTAVPMGSRHTREPVVLLLVRLVWAEDAVG